jgi:sigma-E factor negative regulatory protein RseB
MTCAADPPARLRCLGLLLLLVAQAATANSAGEARQLLAHMMESLRTLDYSGTFVYLHGNRLESMQITHAVRDGQELERIVSLNGSAREVRRDQESVICVMPDAKAVAVAPRASAAGSALWPDLDLDRLHDRYLLHPLGVSRIAGRPARVVGIIPKDRMRYGYRFYLDRDTSLPLKTDLMDERARPLEQVMFTSLTLNTGDAGLGPDPVERNGFRKLTRQPPERGVSGPAQDWRFAHLPAGFRLRMHNRVADESGRKVEHLVLSDGLASVSVYVEPDEDDDDGLRGGAHVGAINAWGALVAKHQVTAVGEVPQATVKAVVEGMRLRKEAAR